MSEIEYAKEFLTPLVEQGQSIKSFHTMNVEVHGREYKIVIGKYNRVQVGGKWVELGSEKLAVVSKKTQIAQVFKINQLYREIKAQANTQRRITLSI